MTPGNPESQPVRLARLALETYVRTGRRMPPPSPIPEQLSSPRACFVSLKEQGALRGCIGTIEPVEASLAEEIISNAISAGTRDPRFVAIETEELDALDYSVDVLSPPEPLDGLAGHDPKRWGLIVEAHGRRGLLLPDLDGVDTARQQEHICRSKAGLAPGEPVVYSRFTVTRYY